MPSATADLKLAKPRPRFPSFSPNKTSGTRAEGKPGQPGHRNKESCAVLPREQVSSTRELVSVAAKRGPTVPVRGPCRPSKEAVRSLTVPVASGPCTAVYRQKRPRMHFLGGGGATSAGASMGASTCK